ncbi:hypothetical protein Hanom_Chr12g01118801 [Helianthus anomalus]
MGFDKSKVTYFKCKQKGPFKRECSNRETNETMNPFYDDYYRKAIYHRTNEQPPKMNQKQIGEGSSKERKQALVELSAAFDEAKRARRWDKQRKCYTDPKANQIVDSKSVDFKALLDVIPTVEELYSKKFVDKNYIPNMECELKK